MEASCGSLFGVPLRHPRRIHRAAAFLMAVSIPDRTRRHEGGSALALIAKDRARELERCTQIHSYLIICLIRVRLDTEMNSSSEVLT